MNGNYFASIKDEYQSVSLDMNNFDLLIFRFPYVIELRLTQGLS